jgi:hypothetical protein
MIDYIMFSFFPNSFLRAMSAHYFMITDDFIMITFSWYMITMTTHDNVLGWIHYTTYHIVTCKRCHDSLIPLSWWDDMKHVIVLPVLWLGNHAIMTTFTCNLAKSYYDNMITCSHHILFLKALHTACLFRFEHQKDWYWYCLLCVGKTNAT